MAKKTDLVAVTGAGTLAVPDYLKDVEGPKGRENIQREDLTLPRLALAQALSPQVDRGDDNYIEGLSNGDLFNSLTREAYGQGPVPVLIVRVEPVRWMEFDEKDRTLILDRNVPVGDPRTKWGEDGTPPRATKFMDFLALHAETAEPLGLSFKSTSIKAGKDINTFIEIYDSRRIHLIGSAQKKNEHGTFYIYTASLGNYAEPEIYAAKAVLTKAWDQANVTVDAKTDADDMAKDVPF